MGCNNAISCRSRQSAKREMRQPMNRRKKARAAGANHRSSVACSRDQECFLGRHADDHTGLSHVLGDRAQRTIISKSEREKRTAAHTDSRYCKRTTRQMGARSVVAHVHVVESRDSRDVLHVVGSVRMQPEMTRAYISCLAGSCLCGKKPVRNSTLGLGKDVRQAQKAKW